MSPRSNDSTRGSGQEATPPAGAPPAAETPRPPSAAGRVDALRRFAAAARRGRGPHLASCAVLLAVAMTAGAVAVGVTDGTRRGPCPGCPGR